MLDLFALAGLLVTFALKVNPVLAMVPPSPALKSGNPLPLRQSSDLSRYSFGLGAQGSEEPWIRVRLGNYLGGARANGQEVVCREGKILIGKSGVPNQQVRLDSPKGMGHSWHGRRYFGEFWVATDASLPARKKGTSALGCLLINRVRLETYLASVLEAEFSSKWSSSAVDAQVIAARSYALRRILDQKERKNSTWDVEQTVKDQVYNGIGEADSFALQKASRAQAAVWRTRGRVLVGESGNGKNGLRPLRALYHSTCGGRTSDPKSTWRQEVRGIQPVVCGECGSSPKAKWRVELTEAEILSALGLKFSGDLIRPLSNTSLPRRIERLEVMERGPEGRALVLEVIPKDVNGNALRPIRFFANGFREKVGTTRLPSTWFEISGEFWDPKIQQPRWILKGSGYGHGLGLCQWGAKTLGEKGASAKEILVKYYPRARIQETY